MEAQPIALAPCSLMLFWAGLLLPVSARDDWRQEWLAETWYRYYVLCQANEWNWRSALQLYRTCAGCFGDARTQFSFDDERWAQLQQQARSPVACLGLLLLALAGISWCTGFCSITRTVLSPLPYRNPDRLALVSRTGRLEAIRRGIPRDLADHWGTESKLVKSIAACSLLRSVQATIGRRDVRANILVATPNLFSVLDSPLIAEREQPQNGAEASVMLSYAFWQRNFTSFSQVVGQHLIRQGRKYVVAGILPRDFWFLSPSIDIYELDGSAIPEQATLIVRTRAGVSGPQLENDLSKVAHRHDEEFTRTAPHVLTLRDSVRNPLWLFFSSCIMAAVLTLLGLSSRFTRRHSLDDLFRTSAGWWVFLFLKTALALLVVLTLGLEYFVGEAQSANEALGGPALLWFFVVGCSTVVFAAVSDQKSRCRVCLHTLAFPIRIGCPGCFFLEWSGTEFLCPEGHGMLYVPHHVSCWEEQDRWIALGV